MSLVFGKRLRGLRRLKRYTQQSMSKKLGISVSMLSSIERGKKYPNYELIKKMAAVLHVPVDELFVLPKGEEQNQSKVREL